MDRLIRILWRQSHAIGLLPSIICAIAWIAFGAVFVRFSPSILGKHPALFGSCLIAVSLIIAFGGLVSFWILSSHLGFRKRGYRVNWLAGDKWVYEERLIDGSVQCIPLAREIVGDGYPAPCSVYIQSEESWEKQAPLWVRNRRPEILKRIAEQFGGRVKFYDVT